MFMHKMSIGEPCVWADLPNCGLGNKLLIWGKASWFAHVHNLPLTVTGWNNRGGLKTWWRGGGWRRYGSDFHSLTWMEGRRFRSATGDFAIIDEPNVDLALTPKTIYRFHQVPHWSDYFGRLHAGRQHLLASLPKHLSSKTRSEIESLPEIDMAVHVRMGDFQALKPGQSFAQVGQTRTPLEYFAEIIENTRLIAKRELPVVVFSDGTDADLRSLLEMPRVQRASSSPAIVDMYSMAKSKLLVCAAGSTFSYWSCFLGKQPTIVHRDHIHGSIRPREIGHAVFEGGVAPQIAHWPDLLVRNITATSWLS